MNAKRKRSESLEGANQGLLLLEAEDGHKKPRATKNWKEEWAESAAKQILEEDLMSGCLPLKARGDEGMSAKQAWDDMYKHRVEFVGMEYKFFKSKLGYLRGRCKKKKGIGVILDWEFSAAKKMLEKDFGTEKLPEEEERLSSKDAWKNYENDELWKGVSYGFFAEKVRALRTKWKRRDAVDWRASSARLIIIYDLESEKLSVDNDEEPAEELWEQIYSRLEEFEDVPFWQFEEKLKDHRQRHRESADLSLEEDLILANDLEIHPTTTHNTRGELKFYLTRAKNLLREDIKRGNQEGLTPSEFQATREEYQPFDKRKFRERIRQEIRFQKFCNYLEDKRKDKLAKAREEELKKKAAKNRSKRG